ncbi:MAG: DUF2461 domain-containing protein [Acidimicrobiia bacterium]
MTTFAGFPRETVNFLTALSKNNNKSWFDAHRADYEAFWVEPAKQFVAAAGESLTELSPEVQAVPRVNGSIFRVNRDIRFSKDKRPYKDHLDFWFWEGERKQAASGYFMRITPTDLGIGVGAHGFDKDRLAAYRSAVVDPKSGPALIKAVQAVEAAGWEVRDQHYKRLPQGFDAANEHQERLLRHSSLWTGRDEPHPKSLTSSRLVSFCMSRWEQLQPLHRWLVDTLQ